MNTLYRFRMAALLLPLLVPVSGFCQGSLTPPGPPAATMKSLNQIEPRSIIGSLPYIISESGSYVVTGNLATDEGHGIIVDAPNVVIDLNGFTLRGSGDPADPGSAIYADSGAGRIVVRNGFIEDWGGDGINARSSSNINVESIGLAIERCRKSGIALGSGRIESTAIRSVDNYGVECAPQVEAAPTTIVAEGLRLSNNGSGGVLIEGEGEVRLIDVEIDGNGGHGVAVVAAGSLSDGSFNGVGLSVSLYGTIVRDNDGHGIDVDMSGDGAVYLSLPGIQDAPYTTKFSSASKRNAGCGIHVGGSGGSVLELNLRGAYCNENGCSGLSTDVEVARAEVNISGGSYSHNGTNGIAIVSLVSGSGQVQGMIGHTGALDHPKGGGLVLQADNFRVFDNDFSNNRDAGISVAGKNTLLLRNICRDNGSGVVLAGSNNVVMSSIFVGSAQTAVVDTGSDNKVAPVDVDPDGGCNPRNNFAY